MATSRTHLMAVTSSVNCESHAFGDTTTPPCLCAISPALTTSKHCRRSHFQPPRRPRVATARALPRPASARRVQPMDESGQPGTGTDSSKASDPGNAKRAPVGCASFRQQRRLAPRSWVQWPRYRLSLIIPLGARHMMRAHARSIVQPCLGEPQRFTFLDRLVVCLSTQEESI